eukprot:CAMPEP_0177549640 /NCGR_PEP_ID=MMETSP0369-20130122/65141_1 /TAXON_ID=447022 ORGANISM="Scrippsiella hangoei-like, Strain SHHI-4" /NCGR_SAMPLE_ID=MMETSP0369 /ASSEMBLY_ACC=CAM_ASM_000364 /LENGTH=73 /DNA_ID=CAMNT_0019034777 /DNA_START=28 /DNA_END=246 /DNA_ORIENTATION=+
MCRNANVALHGCLQDTVVDSGVADGLAKVVRVPRDHGRNDFRKPIQHSTNSVAIPTDRVAVHRRLRLQCSVRE